MLRQRRVAKPSYISRILSVGRAWKRGELTSVPFIADVERDPEQEAERFRDLRMEEVARLLRSAAAIPHLLTFCIISLNTLARPDAVLDLSPAQVDVKRRLIKLNPDGRKQTKKYRPVVPISATLLPWLERCDGPRYVLFHGNPVASVKKSFAKAVAVAGLNDVSPYCLRHTMATELRARGVSEWEAMGMLGHKSPARTTERYAKFRPDYLSGAVRAIDAYFTDLGAAYGDLCKLDPITREALANHGHSYVSPVHKPWATILSYRAANWPASMAVRIKQSGRR